MNWRLAMLTQGDGRNKSSFLFRFFGLSLLLIFLGGCVTQRSATNSFRLKDVIPDGKTTVEVVEVRYSERVEELSLKMSQAIATNQVWFTEYLKNHSGDYPLPYHPNCGLTQTEYAEYLDGIEKSSHLHKVADASLIFKRNGDFVSIDLGDDSSPVVKWQLNIVTEELLLPSGESLKPVWQSKDDEKQPIGAFEGYSWDYDNPSETPGNCHIASLQIYRLRPSTMIFWRIKDGEIQNNHSVGHFDIAFRYAENPVRRLNRTINAHDLAHWHNEGE